MENKFRSNQVKKFLYSAVLSCTGAIIAAGFNTLANISMVPIAVYYGALIVLVISVVARWTKYSRGLEGILAVAVSFLILDMVFSVFRQLNIFTLTNTGLNLVAPFAFIELWIMIEGMGLFLFGSLRLLKNRQK